MAYFLHFTTEKDKALLDIVLTSILAKIRLGHCDQHVFEVLQSRLQTPNINKLELQKTVVICSTRAECDEINSLCLKKLDNMEVAFDSVDTDHHGHPLREADHERLKRHRKRLPDRLLLKSSPEKKSKHREWLGQWYSR